MTASDTGFAGANTVAGSERDRDGGIDALLHLLFLRGQASIAELAEGLQGDTGCVADQLDHAAKTRVAECADGRWRLTRLGRMTHEADVRDHYVPTARRAPIEALYESFLRSNEPFKQCCTDWQLDDYQQPNDHQDFRRDERVVARLERINRSIGRGLAGAEQADARFAVYRRRLDDAIDRLRAGELGAMTEPGGSYHDAWMDLHADLLLSLGRQRDDRDGY